MEAKACVLASGSSGNCIYIEAGNTKVLIDAGMSGCKIANSLMKLNVKPDEIDAVLVTHEHSDHVRGVGVISRRYDLPVFANEATWNCMKPQIGDIKLKNIKCFETNKWFELKGLYFKPFSIPHDAAEPVGFCVYWKNRKITVATDIGHMNKFVFNQIKKSDLLILEANHDVEMLKSGSYPWHLKRRIMGKNGHLSNEEAAKTLVNLVGLGNQQVLLAHLSAENNRPKLAYETIKSALVTEGIHLERDVKIGLTFRNRPTALYYI
ncbi:MAG: hypothetical protein PWQ82_284 [Thermosediminibacterales bacterium]|nr:hypothetical protein [Thermosediminibacterales bacterium]